MTLMIVLTTLVILVSLLLRWSRRSYISKQQPPHQDEHLPEAVPEEHLVHGHPVLERMDGKALDSKEEVAEETMLVGIRKPVGPWSQMIFSEKFDYIWDKLSDKKIKGYWVRRVLAQKQQDQEKGQDR